MNERTYTTIDKSNWDRGPWDNEPDKISWTDEATGLPCLIVRNRGALCGYVGVAPGHPWHGTGYSGCTSSCGEDWCEHSPADLIDVHGGLTFAGGCQTGRPEAEGICHIPEPGASDNVWWFGFDCNHAFDLDPSMVAYYRDRGLGWIADDVYRDVPYVREQVGSLARQLAKVAS